MCNINHIKHVVYVYVYPYFGKVLCTSFLMFHSFISLACVECNDSLLFSGASSIPLCYVLFPATLLHQLFCFHRQGKIIIHPKGEGNMLL